MKQAERYPATWRCDTKPSFQATVNAIRELLRIAGARKAQAKEQEREQVKEGER